MSTAESEQHHAALFEKRLFAGGRSLLASQAIRLGLRVASTVMLARMLNPTDYGIFGMAVVVYGLFYAIRDVGLSTVTVSRHAVTDDEVSALFWINVAVGAILTALFCGLGPAFAAIDSEPRLKAMFPALGACYFINALGQLFVLDLFLGMDYHLYGIDVIRAWARVRRHVLFLVFAALVNSKTGRELS